MRRIRPTAVTVFAASLLASATALSAQEVTGPVGQPGAAGQGSQNSVLRAPLPIALLNQERLLSQTRYGQRIQREIEAAGARLTAENRQIETRLMEEELDLTEQRRRLSAEAFRPLAEEFDTRVEAIRAAQEAKSRALQSQAEAAQARFFEDVFPLLIELLRARGAAVLMDNRAVLLSVEGADITDEAIALIDTEIGEGPSGLLIDLDGTGTAPQSPPATEDSSPAP